MPDSPSDRSPEALPRRPTSRWVRGSPLTGVWFRWTRSSRSGGCRPGYATHFDAPRATDRGVGRGRREPQRQGQGTPIDSRRRSGEAHGRSAPATVSVGRFCAGGARGGWGAVPRIGAGRAPVTNPKYPTRDISTVRRTTSRPGVHVVAVPIKFVRRDRMGPSASLQQPPPGVRTVGRRRECPPPAMAPPDRTARNDPMGARPAVRGPARSHGPPRPPSAARGARGPDHGSRETLPRRDGA